MRMSPEKMRKRLMAYILEREKKETINFSLSLSGRKKKYFMIYKLIIKTPANEDQIILLDPIIHTF
jgi:hypothetical protein